MEMKEAQPQPKEVEKAAVGQYALDDPSTPPTRDEENAVIRKLDWHILPLVFVLYSFSVLDRSNLGNAKLAGLENAVDLSGNRYNLLGTIFYIAYICFQWCIIGWKQFRPHQFATAVVFLWGFVATIQATATSWSGLMACRFFLGIAEAMYGPGVPFYLSFFYPRERIGFREGVFIAGAAMANAYGGALAYALAEIRGRVAPWQALFLIEGLPTCALAVIVWFFLTDSIEDAPFLNEREKQIALHFVGRNQQVDEGKKTGLRWKELVYALKDFKSYIPAMMYFSCNVSFASLPLFVPTIIKDLGVFSSAQSNGLSAPPYVLCFFMIITLCWLSDRYRVRGPFSAFAATLAAIGFIVQATTTAPGVRYFGVFLAVQIFCSVALTLSWVANLHATETKRAGGMAILGTIGQCGPLLGTNVFPSSEAPYFRAGMWISAAFCLLVALLSVLLSSIQIYENKKMQREGMIQDPATEIVDGNHVNAIPPEKILNVW